MWSQQQQFPNQFTPQGPPPDSRGGGGYVFPQQQQQRPHHQQQRPPQNNNNNKGPPYDSSLSSARTLWFGDLEAEWDEGYVRSLFRNNRVRVTMMRTHCFLEFESRDEAGATLQELAGRPIPGHPNKPFSLRWAGEKKKPVEVVTLNENSVFVGDLDYAITEAELLEAFRKRYPKSAVSAKIIVDQATQHSKGFGFVRFSSAGDRDRAIQEMHGQVLGDRPIRVTHASSREERGLAPNPAHVQSSNFPKSSYDPSRYAMPKATEEGENTCVFVGGLDESVTPEMLRHHFGLLGDIAYIRIPPGRGCGFVGFVHRKNAEAAISTLQGLRINGYKVRLSWGSMRNGARTAAAKNQQNVVSRVGGGVASTAAAPPVVRPLPGTTPPLVVTQVKKEHKTSLGVLTHEYNDDLPEPPETWIVVANDKQGNHKDTPPSSSATSKKVSKYNPIQGPLVLEPDPPKLLDPDDGLFFDDEEKSDGKARDPDAKKAKDDAAPQRDDNAQAHENKGDTLKKPAASTTSPYVAQLRARYAAYNASIPVTSPSTKRKKHERHVFDAALANERYASSQLKRHLGEAASNGVEIPIEPPPFLSNPTLDAAKDTPMAHYSNTEI